CVHGGTQYGSKCRKRRYYTLYQGYASGLGSMRPAGQRPGRTTKEPARRHHAAPARAEPRILVQADWISGRNTTIRPRPMIELTSAFEKNTPSPPCEASNDCRNASSALSPSTIASTIGASG